MVDLAVHCKPIATGGTMFLEPEQEELLAKFVKSHRNVPREQRGPFLVSQTFNSPDKFRTVTGQLQLHSRCSAM